MSQIRYEFKVTGHDRVSAAFRAVNLAALDGYARVFAHMHAQRSPDGHVRLFLGAQGLARRRLKRGWRKRADR